MKLIDELRRENLASLRVESGGLNRLAEKLERDASQVSQWMLGSKNSGTGKPRGMRSGTARFIELKCGKPQGWLDVEHADQPNTFLQNTKENCTLAHADKAPVAIYGVASLEQSLEGLAAYLEALDDTDKQQVMRMIAVLAEHPDRHIKQAAGIRAMVGAPFLHDRRKSA